MPYFALIIMIYHAKIACYQHGAEVMRLDIQMKGERVWKK